MNQRNVLILVLLSISLNLVLMRMVSALEGDFQNPSFNPESTKTFSYYPGGEVQMARTARTWVSFMIDETGKTYAPMIEQANNDRFNKAALKWVEMMAFEPATLDGKPISTWNRHRARFNIGYGFNSPQVRTKLFNKHNNKFNLEIAKVSPDQKKLQKYLKKMAGAKHGSQLAYEYISLARYKYAAKYGSRDDQIYALKEMILSNDRGMAVLNGDLADKELLRLTIEAGYYGEAMVLYQELIRKQNRRFEQAVDSNFGESMQKISDLFTSDKEFIRNITIGDSGYSFFPIAKSNIRLEDIAGQLTKLVLRCERQYKEFEITQGSAYPILEAWGKCQLQVVGNPDSKAQLVQY